MFSHLCPWKHHKCVLKPSEQGSFFSETIDLRGHMPRFTLKMNILPSPEKPHKCVLKPQNSVRFSETIDLRGHMPRFTLQMNVFPSISLETP